VNQLCGGWVLLFCPRLLRVALPCYDVGIKESPDRSRVVFIRDCGPMTSYSEITSQVPGSRQFGICTVQFASVEICGRSFELMNTPSGPCLDYRQSLL